MSSPAPSSSSSSTSSVSENGSVDSASQHDPTPSAEPPRTRKKGKKVLWKKTKVAKTPGTQQKPPQHLKPGDTHVTCELTGDISITFTGHAESMCAKGDLLPTVLYRTAYEGSATLSQFVTPDCLIKHKDVPHLKLHDENAFQNVGDLILTRDLNQFRVQRQFVPNKKVDPSALVSLTSDYGVAFRRANTQYNKSKLVGHRVYIAQVKTTGLVPVTVHGDEQLVETLYGGLDEANALTVVTSKATKRRVHIPVWMRDVARPADGSAINLQQFYDSGADMYISIDENRLSDMGVHASTGYDKEWLLVGPILMTAIDRVMPFDGKEVHHTKGNQVVQSRQSILTYIWNFDVRRWLHNPDMSNISHYRNELPGDKRKSFEDELDEALANVRKRILESGRGRIALEVGNTIEVQDELDVEDTEEVQVQDDLVVEVEDQVEIEVDVEVEDEPGIKDELEFSELDVGDDSDVEEDQSVMEDDQIEAEGV